MASGLIAAVMEKYESFTFASADQARIYFDEKPQVGSGQILPPYAVLTDGGTVPDYTLEYVPIDVTNFTLTLYAGSLADADAMAQVVRFNGGTTQQHLGLDHCTALNLDSPRYKMEVMLKEVTFGLDKPRGHTGSLVYKAVMRYEAQVSYTA